MRWVWTTILIIIGLPIAGGALLLGIGLLLPAPKPRAYEPVPRVGMWHEVSLNGAVGCADPADIDEARRFVQVGDKAAVVRLVNAGRCDLLAPREWVEVRDYSVWTHRVTIRKQGALRLLAAAESAVVPETARERPITEK